MAANDLKIPFVSNIDSTPEFLAWANNAWLPKTAWSQKDIEKLYVRWVNETDEGAEYYTEKILAQPIVWVGQNYPDLVERRILLEPLETIQKYYPDYVEKKNEILNPAIELDPNAITPYELEALQLQREQGAQQERQFLAEQARLSGASAEEAAIARERLAWEKEQAKAKADTDWATQLASLSQPRDWINRWYMERMPKPSEKEQALTEFGKSNIARYKAEEEVGKWTGKAEEIDRLGAYPEWTVPEGAEVGAQEQAAQAGMSPAIRDRAWVLGQLVDAQTKLINAVTGQTYWGSKVNKEMEQPPVPGDWIRGLSPQLTGATVPRQGTILNPSVTTAAQLSTPQWEMIEGLSQHWGERPIEEMIWSAKQATPTGTIGKKYWRPAKQVV